MKQNLINKYRFSVVVLLVMFVLVAICVYFNPQPTIRDGHIQRPYNQLLRFLEEDPADISSKSYEPTIPNIVLKDIDRMLASNGDLDILYYTDNPSRYIQIEVDSESSTGIRLTVYDDYFERIEAENNISMYKSEESIVIYAPSYSFARHLDCYKFSSKSLDYVSLDNDHLDLYGANISYDTVRDFNHSISLVKNGNDFMFYKLGNQVGKTWHFPGGEIIEFNYYYILDDKHDMYYLYFCSHPDNPWIKFIKVDSDISDSNADYFDGNFMETSSNVKYPIYSKNGERYVGVSNIDTEKAFGQGYGKNYNSLDEGTFDFEIVTLRLSIDNASNVSFHKHNVGSFSDEYDWYLHYNYTAKGQTLYYEERINGLDSYLTTIIPEEELAKFNKKTVSVEYLEDAVNELKQLYERYE